MPSFALEAGDESIIRVTVVRTAEGLVPATTMNFPRRLDVDGVLKLGKSLEALPQADEYVFDFSHFGHAEPFGMPFAAAIIQEFLSRRGACVAAQNLQGCGYQSHMGFFQAIAIEHGNKPGDAAGGENYLPMTSMNVAALRRKADVQGVQLGDVIQRDAERMAERLARTDEGDIFDALSYSLREIIRNFAEHSEAPDVRFCLQHWPTKPGSIWRFSIAESGSEGAWSATLTCASKQIWPLCGSPSGLASQVRCTRG
jgi:hypothetical protein